MTESTFNPQLFEQQVITDANETEYTPVPAGEYIAYIEDYKIRQVERKNSPGEFSYPMDVYYVIPDDNLKAMLEKDKVVVKGGCWLDIDESGGLKFGKNTNVQLGQIREACGQNKAGEPWSLTMLRGAGPVLIAVTIDPSDDGKKYNRVNSVVAASTA